MAATALQNPLSGRCTTFEPSSENEHCMHLDEDACTTSNAASLLTTPISTPMTSGSSTILDAETKFQDLNNYIAVGCLHYDPALPPDISHSQDTEWVEIIHANVPEELKSILGQEASRLLAARWIRLFLHSGNAKPPRNHSIARVYLLPEDWGRRVIDRNSKSLKLALRQLLQQIDISREAWFGDYSTTTKRYFDPWATAENVSLYYLFNKLPSPAPAPEKIKNRFSRRAVEDLLDSAHPPLAGKLEEQPFSGLKTKLYPYQARSASLMVQRETAPQLQLDPRLELRESPNGVKYYFGARDGSFLQEPRFYETNRGGILAETMGLGKTIICLSVILATRGHLPQIPAIYQPLPRVRGQVGSLKDMAASTIARFSIPAKDELERYEAFEDIDLSKLKDALKRNTPFYEIPPQIPRMNRTTKIPPPRQLLMCSGTIVVVPRNLLHQWQSEIRKHMIKGSLKILVVDSISKRSGKSKTKKFEDDQMVFRSDLPVPSELIQYDILLFTRSRFEQEIVDGTDMVPNCQCPFIGSSRVPDCSCSARNRESPLKKIHWLRIIIDEGHSFSSSFSNAVLVAKQIQAERRWVVSGTPAKNLVGVEVDLATLEDNVDDPMHVRELAIEKRKAFHLDEENTKAAKALGSLAAHFLMVRPWSDDTSEGKLDWEEYIYRHENQYRKTFSGFSTCFLRTLEGLVVKTRPDDVERDIVLPAMRHRVVYLKPCWFDKMTANLFIQVLRANAITSERSDVDYLFHKNSVKARHSLIRNLRQSNFTWTGFSLEDVASTLETSSKYLDKQEKKCTIHDANLLLESSSMIAPLAMSDGWIALSKAHEVGMAIEDWPQDSEESFSLEYPNKPTMIGLTQLLDGQLHVDSQIRSDAPSEGLLTVGRASKAKIAEIAQAEDKSKKREKSAGDSQLRKVGVPSSCVNGQPSRRTTINITKTSPQKGKTKPKATAAKGNATTAAEEAVESLVTERTTLPVRPRKRKLTLFDETAELAEDSPLRKTRVVGTTSAKLSYLIGKIMKHQATEKIIVFYDGDNAAFYIAQCLEMLYVNHRIYARTLDNTKRSEYVALFNEDPDIRVLLIDVACGALGLNLNAASVVLIVNPINRPEIEAQAIKRAHRIGQTREVLVETLVLQGTMEEAIFKRAQNMSRQQHLDAKELEDDAGIVDIIQNAQVIPIEPGEDSGFAKFARLDAPQQVFGRPNRDKYHRYGMAEAKEKPNKKAKTAKTAKTVGAGAGAGSSERVTAESGQSTPVSTQAESEGGSSIFGMGSIFTGSLFGP